MPPELPYHPPVMLGEQYMLSSVESENEDSVIYYAQQKDIRRDVLVETLRPECVQDDAKLAFFLETARAKTRMNLKSVGLSLELLFTDETWHHVREKILGEPLDIMLASGRKLTVSHMCSLLMELCHICMFMDVEGLNCRPFALSQCYLMEYNFRFDNPTCGGQRMRHTSRVYLREASKLLYPLLEDKSSYSGLLLELLNRLNYSQNWETLTPMYLSEELAQLKMRMLWDEVQKAN